MSDLWFYAAILFAFVIVPAVFVLGLQGGVVAIIRAPRVAERFGIELSPTLARLAMAVLILLLLAFFSPGLALMASVIAAVLLPPAIVLILLFALFRAWADGGSDFGGTFWRIANRVPVLCLAFVIAVIPISVARYQAAQIVAQPARR